MTFPRLGYGVGLRPKHYDEVLTQQPAVDWFEVISENFMVDGGRPLHVLNEVREGYPIVLHGVSMSIGSTDPLNWEYLRRLRELTRRFEPVWISDHLCWTGVGGNNAHDLLPLPYTEEAVEHVAERLRQVQDFLGRQILLENVSTYLEFAHSTMPEWEFLTAGAERADCGILLDVNNVFVSAFNHGFSASAYLAAIPIARVQQLHLAGHTDRTTFLHDTHDHPVTEAVWDLYAEAVRRFGPVSTLLERDDHIPPLADLLLEVERARGLATTICDERSSAAHRPAAVLEAHQRA
jgi:uncharacterized protein (UPF0276 family)